ncbi:hemolysin family protein [Demequina sp. NBRC 110056]|uniref:hemolysin family protein n=1 Tax=Demequina sp. NBRC 110056 TaxID=1570345 RepID=UPI000A079299|nr:hemolysin family protein [Demequina sp. NBRC 110056]
MTGSTLLALALVGAFSVLGAAVLHAVVAALEQLPHAEEREVAARRRPDGKPTSAARIAAIPSQTDDAASVAYATLEAVGVVCLTFIVAELAVDLDWPLLAVVLLAAALAVIASLLLVRAFPRQLARAHPLTTLGLVSPVAWLLIRLTTPIRAIVPALQMPPLAEPEDLVEQAQDALEEEDALLLRSVVSLGDTLTREVMVPRTDMITIASGTAARKAMVLFMRSGFSRVPVIGDGVDDTVGVVYLKDVVKQTWDDAAALEHPVDEFMREPEFVPESVPVDDLLRRMQDEVFHMAIVVDEYGGVAGLVTIEDALEEIVGEVVDEHDRSAPDVEDLGDGRYRVPARYPLDELGELFDIEIDDEDVETAAGLLSKALGKVPIPGARASAHGLGLTADRVEGRRRRLTAVIVEREDDEEDEDD